MGHPQRHKVPRAAHKGGERTLGYKGTKSKKQKAKSKKQKADPSARPPYRTQNWRALGTPVVGLVMTGYKREEDSPEGVGGKIRVRLRVPPEIVKRDFRGGGTLHHPITRKNGARWGPRLRASG